MRTMAMNWANGGASPAVPMFWAGEAEGSGGSPQPEPAAGAELTPTEPPAGEAGAEGSPQPIQEDTEGEKAPTAEAAPPAPVDWRNNEINRLRSQLERERTKQATTTPAKPTPAPAPTQTPGESAAAFEERVQAAAQQRVMVQNFERSCNDAAAAGRASFGEDFDNRLKQITGNLVDAKSPDSLARYNQFLLDAIEAADGDPSAVAKVLYELGGDLNEADRVMNLSPVKRGSELARLSAREAAPVSGAPKPITPVSARGERHDAIAASDPTRADKLSTAAWMERRNAEVKAREARA